jgi:hypothetical protein
VDAAGHWNSFLDKRYGVLVYEISGACSSADF